MIIGREMIINITVYLFIYYLFIYSFINAVRSGTTTWNVGTGTE